MDFDDVIKKDKRKFFEYYCESIKQKQLIINTFIVKEPLKPITIKMMLFIMNILLYFVINGLFYNEEYISEVYHLEEEEKFFSFFKRSVNRIVYTTIVTVIVNFIIEFFYIEEKKLKGIFNREKEDLISLQCEVALLIKNIHNSYISYIILSFILFFMFLYYILCFNYVYPYIQGEWIKSSIIIVIIIQLLSFLYSIVETILRVISFQLKNEKIYKLSKILN